MTLVSDISSIPNFRSKARNIVVEVSGVINLEYYVSQASRALIASLPLQRTDAEAIAQ